MSDELDYINWFSVTRPSPLHLLPAVPGMPLSGSRLQKSGEGERYTRSRAAGGLTCVSRGSKAVLDPIRVRRTWEDHGVKKNTFDAYFYNNDYIKHAQGVK